MKLRSAFVCCLLVAIAGCSKQAAAPSTGADSAAAEQLPVPTQEFVKYWFDLPGDAIVALRFDPTDLAGEKVGIRRIALVTDQGTQEMDACAPKGVQKVRIASASVVDGVCEMVFGADTNSGWMGLSKFGSLPAAQQARHLEIEITKPKGKGPMVLFDTGKGYNFEQRIPGTTSPGQAAEIAAAPSGEQAGVTADASKDVQVAGN
jgi:hypothetical protein